MTTSEVLSPPPPAAVASLAAPQLQSLQLPIARDVDVVSSVTETGDISAFARSAWRNEAGKTSAFGPATMLDMKAEALEMVQLDNWSVQPVDRGPAPAAPDPKLLRSWQYQVAGKLATAQVLVDLKTEHIKSGGPMGMKQEAIKHIVRHKPDDTFYVVDLANVQRMFKAWRAAMPRVVPFYAVKCNPEPGILKLLVAMGAGFDCASKGELEMMLRMGVPQSRIIFAHPCKRPSDIRYARDHGIQYTTFDTISELHKIAQMNPDFKCVLRIRADDPDARVPLGLKYGAEVSEAPVLLRTAKELGLQVVGVSFHVGSACQNLSTFTGAIENARKVFDEAHVLGFNMELLDIGGGFTGHFDEMGNVMFGEIANTINTSLAAYFPPEMGVRVIAEPGRYFAETSSTLLTPVYGQRDRVAQDGSVKKDYWLTDGLYGSFNCILYDGQNPAYKVVRSPLLPEPADNSTYTSTLWGPTCDSADCVYKDVSLPVLRNGDWLMWNNAGAYTVAGACDFNGIEFTTPGKLYVWSDVAVDQAEDEEKVMEA
ncbi:Mitochondrial 2-oxoadipate and 2-oxoglutarate transporter [Pleodorina starrii]|uniref:ornithine decarboxylase n=1 Tax=Pleodorina starrii TaxID=330485 RepID=A0A9W6BSK2_9CHLO|nr:Mitochondrial 2-oxoadipate and 2-oxoglutarate transporter [Pleodorina starrii]GLC56736.1 Mitochondrial 2-oxoadipate and 2-oxoglutarate transporter [Pleodorina starrii]GLC66893.1 Mitochondrial 2-oxoadipate and 2-oxoglutarate transporter [Pleodorina starrii]